MPNCARCGARTSSTPSDSDFAYCSDCMNLFEEADLNGVSVKHDDRHGYTVEAMGERLAAGSQTQALAQASYLMSYKGLNGVFRHRKSRSWWLIDEYLEEHPDIKADVDRLQELSGTYVPVENLWEDASGPGVLSRIAARLRI